MYVYYINNTSECYYIQFDGKVLMYCSSNDDSNPLSTLYTLNYKLSEKYIVFMKQF